MVPTLRHVLVIGVDGVRFDLLGPGVTPVIWGFRLSGFLGPVPVDEATPTWPGPCWATIATGTGADGHGITSNDLTGHRLADHPDFVTVATRAGVSTLLAVSGWAPLAVTALADLIPAGAEAPRLSFVYLGAVDAAGHLLGAGPAYREAARSADQRVGRLLAALGDLSGH